MFLIYDIVCYDLGCHIVIFNIVVWIIVGFIWNREAHYRNRVFSMYLFGTGAYRYVPVRTEYRPVQEMNKSTYQYIPVRTEYVPK